MGNREYIVLDSSIKNAYICSKLDNYDGLNACVQCCVGNDDDKVTYGVGNVMSKFIIILPSYDVRDTKRLNILDIIEKRLIDLKIGNLTELAYCTRLVKCKTQAFQYLENTSAGRCVNHLYNELNKYKFVHIINCSEFQNDILHNNVYKKFIVHDIGNANILFTNNIGGQEEFINKLINILQQ